ncbi:hypothetical protein DOTSEDRAFT_35812 [Dothistroma septosporum NZE10]|uniref:Uncharacterized protein n=1 Tax=Dothistroma septosporum (strain NZE10 / CBS 128990) TaxID=675120 RepID=M2WNI3_DOTSN|nr:hypothetical protein DOTSEDRAFT_35812 [Dothistroma septosporum NZE10]
MAGPFDFVTIIENTFHAALEGLITSGDARANIASATHEQDADSALKEIQALNTDEFLLPKPTMPALSPRPSSLGHESTMNEVLATNETTNSHTHRCSSRDRRPGQSRKLCLTPKQKPVAGS